MSKKKRKKKKFQKNRNYYFLTITSIKNGNRSPSQINQVHNLICTPFSFAGSFYMIHSYFKSCTKSFSSRLVFCLALSDLLLSICDLIDVIEPANSQNCTIVGFLRILESTPTRNPLQHALDHSNTLYAFWPICAWICWSWETFSLSGDRKYSRKLSSKSCHFISAKFWWWVIIRRL